MAIYLFCRLLLPLIAPMLLALISAMALERPVKALCARRIPRPAASGLCLGVFLALLGLIFWLLCHRLSIELQHLGTRLPEIASAVSSLLERWQNRLSNFSRPLPPSVTQVLSTAAEGLREYLRTLPAKVSSRAVEFLTEILGKLPTWLLFCVTWLMGLYFISAAYPQIAGFLQRRLPPRLRQKAINTKHSLAQSLGKYIKAQIIMSAIAFVEIFLAFILLGIGSPLVLALAVAVIDALPVFGAGTVLLPWSAAELLAGDPGRGLGLAISYAAVTILRSCIQAKLLGDQLGLHPIATLLAIYAGWKAMGVWGMIIFPIGAISLKKLNDCGAIRLWNKEETHDRSNFQYNCGDGHEHSGSYEHPSG